MVQGVPVQTEIAGEYRPERVSGTRRAEIRRRVIKYTNHRYMSDLNH